MVSSQVIDPSTGALTTGALTRGADYGRLNGAQRVRGQLQKSRGVPLAR